jgi:hypothetical protein
MADLTLSLSLTQTSEQSPHVFVDASGSPLSLYLDVNPEILARPRLIRLLRVRIAVSKCHTRDSTQLFTVIRSGYMSQSFSCFHHSHQFRDGIRSQVCARLACRLTQDGS